MALLSRTSNAAAALAAVLSGCGGGSADDADAGGYGHGCWGCYYLEIFAGSFGMGCHSDQEPDCDSHADALPVHEVAIGRFYMMVHEVEQGPYCRCVEAGACTEPAANYEADCDSTIALGNVTWEQADQFCRWAQARLPTEAEWEYAARGSQNYSYPGGNDPSGAAGRSPFGLYYMAEVYAEWVADFYDPGYYAVSPSDNPQGPATGADHVVRGGSNLDPLEDRRTWVRKVGEPGDNVGFRCAADSVGDGADAGS